MEKYRKTEKINKTIMGWIEERLQSEGKTIKRYFNDIDLANPSVREAIQSDPTLTEEQKRYVLKTGSLPKRQYHERKQHYKEFSVFVLLTLSGIAILFNSLNTTGFAISNFSHATPSLSGLLFFIAGLIGLFLASGISPLSLQRKIEEIESIETAKGSRYRYLQDGKTQRFKKVEGKQYEPQDALVFIPDWETIKRIAPEKILKGGILGENETQYHQELLNYQHRGRISITDSNGNVLRTNKQIDNEKGMIFLAFQKKGSKTADFIIPVSTTPQLGYYTFDRRTYEKGGENLTEKHIGNKVVKINYKNGKVVS